MSRHKVVASLGAIFVVVLPIVGNSVYAQRPAVHLGLEIAAAVLGVFGYTLAKPLFGGTKPAP